MKYTKNIFRLFSLLLLATLLFSSAITRASEETSLPYLNPDLSVEERVADLISRMSLEEKIGQMTLIEKGSIQPQAVTDYFIGGVLSGGGGYPTPNTAESWLEMVNAYQEAALATPLAIPMIYGVDAVHGHNNVYGAVIFPQNIGLGASRNAELVQQIGRITALEMIATGIYWNYAPILSVPQDIRWGRAYEAYGENTELVTELSTAMLIGLQGDDISAPHSVLGTPKHYVGDGGATWGTSPFGILNIDRGETMVDEETLRRIHLPPYIDAIEAGAKSIMTSYSSWDGINMHGQTYLIQEVLRGELGFDGFIVSDWEAIDVLGETYYESVVASVNAGVDMVMVPYDYVKFTTALNEAVENGDVSLERIDEAVNYILRVKFELGLFETPFGDETLLDLVGSDEHRAVAREAVSQSLVLLKNEDDLLPLSSDLGTVFITGEGADDIGIQSGGWTIEWQGTTGVRSTIGTTIIEAIQQSVSEDTKIVYNKAGLFDKQVDENGELIIADLGIAVISERPYTEYMGDNALINIPRSDLMALERLSRQSERVLVIVVSGRPVMITDQLLDADAMVAVWLPGTEALGITDVLFGERDFVGQLSYTWPRTLSQIPFDFEALPTEGCDAPLFPYGYGLTYENAESPYLDLAVECATPVEEVASVQATVDAESLAPDGIYGESYYAPTGVSITLDGSFDDWAGVPRQTVPEGNDFSLGAPSVTFAIATDDEYLYFWGDVVDNNIISGQHGADYWNEDSIEFYINATGDLSLTSYTDGVAQLTIPPINAELPEAQAPFFGGVRGETAEAQIVTVYTETGYAVEVAIPLNNAVWSIDTSSTEPLGVQVHLNIATSSNRNAKLMWSTWDNADQSYLNPSLFGELYFYQNENTAVEADDAEAVAEAEEIIEEVPSTAEQVNSAISRLLSASIEETPEITWDSREWVLMWSDEFDEPANTPINDEFWTCEVGGHGWGNGERQYYTREIENGYHDGEGNFAIVARAENPNNEMCRYGTCEYTSARCITQDKVEFTYGRVEARIKVPFGQGIWPALWMLGANFDRAGWPSSGEIDIMEYIGKEPYTAHGTVHGPLYSGANGIGGRITLPYPVADDFRVFAIDWDVDAIRWYVDGVNFFTLTPDDLPPHRTWVFDHDFFLLMNVAVGGGWPGYPDETTQFPQTMLVDYIRVYQLADSE
jgi:beta-glucosidase